jgi:hypothetical protein
MPHMTTRQADAAIPRRMTLAEARATVRAMGFTLRSTDGEYRLCPRGGSEAVAYYTNDLTDAVGTAKLQQAGK